MAAAAPTLLDKGTGTTWVHCLVTGQWLAGAGAGPPTIVHRRWSAGASASCCSGFTSTAVLSLADLGDAPGVSVEGGV